MSQYKPPQNGLLSYLPATWVPYAELARIDKPVACLYLYFPCIFGTCLVALTTKNVVPPSRLLSVNLIFLGGSFLVRCAGCSWNDIVDQDFDRKVSRTCTRPMARRAISTPKALTFTVLQVLIGLGLVVLLLPTPSLYYCVPSMLLTYLYPYGKRFTHYPQLILGCVFSWGVVMAFPAFDADPLSSDDGNNVTAAGFLYLSCVAWTVSYDTIYAAQDTKDDVKAGIKSPVVLHQGHTRKLLTGAALAQVTLLCCTGWLIGATAVYFVTTCLGTGLMLGRMVSRVDLDDPRDCFWWFTKGCFFTGATISSGFVAEYFLSTSR